MNKFKLEKYIQHIFGTPSNKIQQGTAKEFNRTVQDILILAKDHQKDYYSIENSISDFLLYYNDRLHLTTKVVPFKAMMNANDKDKEIMRENKEITLKGILKAKIISENYPNGSYIRVSNYIIIINKEYVLFILYKDYKSP